jgi:hypothetical protein
LKIHNGVLHVVDSHTTICPLKVRSLRNTLIGAISSTEVHDSGPVIGKVLRELAGRTTSINDESAFGVHRCIEAILYSRVESIKSDDKIFEEDTHSTDNLMEM